MYLNKIKSLKSNGNNMFIKLMYQVYLLEFFLFLIFNYMFY